MQKTPQYTAPPPDPALATLQAQTDQQRQAATQLDVEALNARHAMMYGTRMALGSAGGGGGWLNGGMFTPANNTMFGPGPLGGKGF